MTKRIWRARLILAIVAFMISGGGTSAAFAADDGLTDFVETYQCSLAGLIAKIHAHKVTKYNRFVVLALPGPTAAYVQCLLDGTDYDRLGLCEASSGWWNNPSERPHFGAGQLEALKRLGFSTDGSHGNFRQEMHFTSDGPEPYELATLMLSTLYEGYGARKGMQIEVVAPFALKHGFLPRERCVPIS